jgi:hypothetical protein
MGRRHEKDAMMPRKTIEHRIAELEERKRTLKARLGKQERAEDTRRKILLGAFVLHRLAHGRDRMSQELAEWLRRELPGFLSRDQDRALFAELLGSQSLPSPMSSSVSSSVSSPSGGGETDAP